MRAYKFRVYPNKTQEREMRKHLWIEKNLWNELLEHTRQMYEDYGMFASRLSMQVMVKGSGLYSQTAQDIAHRIDRSTKRFLQARKRGESVGFPRFRSIDRMKSLCYPQSGFRVNGKKLKATPFGEIRIVQHREMVGEIKTMALKREASGKWFAVFTVEEPEVEPKINNGTEIGIDVGLKSFAVTSEGETIANPRHYRTREKRLAVLQRRMSAKDKFGRNWRKAKVEVARLHEDIQNARSDFLHKESRRLVSQHSLIALEDLNVQELAGKGYGKSINDAGWTRFASMLEYKAESAGSKVMLVDPAYTTMTCHRCGNVQDMPLKERWYHCPKCGMVEGRDLNAAKNILARATAGLAGSNASGDVQECAS